MRQCQLMRKLLEFVGSRAERKAARTWSGCGCVEDVLTGNAVDLFNVCAL